MDNFIVKNWKGSQRKLPAINCIVYPDGHVTVLSYCHVYNPNTNENTDFCNPLCDTTIDSVVKYDNDIWVSVDEWVSIDYKNGKIYGGDGAMGHEGFIACADENDNLIWGMFFTDTNPIKSLDIKGSTLIALNEHSELQLEINLDILTDITITLYGHKKYGAY